MSEADVSLFELLNFSIGTPQSGAVNFSALHALLHAILRQLGIQEVKTGWRDTPPDGGHPDAPVGATAIQAVQDELHPASSPPPTPCSGSPGGGQWRRDDVSKAVDLIQDLHKQQDDLRQETQELLQSHQMVTTQVEACRRRVDALENAVLSLTDAVQKLPEELSQFVKWDVLQVALLRDRGSSHEDVINSPSPSNTIPSQTRTPPPHPDVEDTGRPATPSSPSASGQITSDQEVMNTCGALATPQVSHSEGAEAAAGTPPSQEGVKRYPETVEALTNIGKLKEKFDDLEARVAALKEGNVELADLRELVTSQGSQVVLKDLTEQLQQQSAVVEGVMGEQERNLQLLNDGRQMMLQLQAQCEELLESTRGLQEDSRQRQRLLENLFKQMEQLEDRKADKHMVETEIKADKSALDSKVSRLQFDSVTEQLNAMFHELLTKVTGQEQDWNQVIERLSTEMERKLNRMELDSVKKQLEGRWRSIHEKLQAQGAPEQEDAAALRKQLVDRFHCLSCDRPVMKSSPGPHLVTLPSTPAFPAHKSIRPFTVYALEQFRQHYRSERLPEPADYSHAPPTRSCGGGHTLTPTGQRRSGLQSMKHQSEVDESEEIDIIGLDGHVYRGRLNAPVLRNAETRLPAIPSTDGVSKAKDKNRMYKHAASPEAGLSGLRPNSAKSAQCSRSASSSSGRDWPVSALACSVTQAPAAAEGNDQQGATLT